jgi:hypothetical protein
MVVLRDALDALRGELERAHERTHKAEQRATGLAEAIAVLEARLARSEVETRTAQGEARAAQEWSEALAGAERPRGGAGACWRGSGTRGGRKSEGPREWSNPRPIAPHRTSAHWHADQMTLRTIRVARIDLNQL